MNKNQKGLYNFAGASGSVTQSCVTLCNPMDCSLPGSSVHGILQARILEWLAIPFSRGSSQPRNQTRVSCIAGRFFTIWATRDACHHLVYGNNIITMLCYLCFPITLLLCFMASLFKHSINVPCSLGIIHILKQFFSGLHCFRKFIYLRSFWSL